MALVQMRKMCTELTEKYPSLTALIVYHRTGEVPAGQCSVLIVSASPHRADAIAATTECIDLVKTRVPIWKKEHYEGQGEESLIENAKWK